MSWEAMPAELRAAMEEHLTAKQLEVMRYFAQGESNRAVARILGIDRKAVRDRFEAAVKRLEAAGVERPA